MPGEYVTAVFKLHGLEESVRTNEGIGNIFKPRICILGSIPELGKWDLEKHVKASPTGKFNKWEARVLIPAGSTFEWSWIVMNNKCTKILFWDPCRRNTSLATFGGAIHVAWGRPTQAFRSDHCGMEVSVNYQCTHGQYLVLTGGEPGLGNWDPRMGVEAREEFPPGSGQWKANLVVDKMQNIDWKWVVVEGPGRKVIRWQESNNDTIFIEKDQDRIEVEATWDGQCIVHSHNFRLRPDYEERDDSETLTVQEKLQDMERAMGKHGHRLEERNQPRRRSDKQDENRGSKSNVTRMQNVRLPDRKRESEDVHGQTTSGTQKVDDTSQKAGFSPFRWISGVVTTYLNLIEV